MNTQKIKTLEHLHETMETIESARAIMGLTLEERIELENSLLKLRNLERDIIRRKTVELVEALHEDSVALKELAAQIKQSSEKLGRVANAIEKAVRVVDSLVSIITPALSAGLL